MVAGVLQTQMVLVEVGQVVLEPELAFQFLLEQLTQLPLVQEGRDQVAEMTKEQTDLIQHLALLRLLVVAAVEVKTQQLEQTEVRVAAVALKILQTMWVELETPLHLHLHPIQTLFKEQVEVLVPPPPQPEEVVVQQ